ncbi:hypothetical protein C8A03DRAFT_44984 [Achaetomium macrosporum]|uniref:Polyketide synthase n=1 Tax=Achaetomium macrosporum TaxID=79813 RepID=A0AAN7C997_9PEZI|nr:hypothetical protein C8A03DRAFT_44984 [Achaetomium macrosporum]
MPYKQPIHEPIAIVGASCRFTGNATSPSRLWELLAHPRDLTREVPPQRFNINAFYHQNGEYHGTTSSPKAYFIDQDHRAIDPQQRMLLEVYAGEKVGRDELFMNQYYATGNARSILANRISYFFNFNGPLVALHQAMACFIVESNLHMLSPTGHCRMWDAGANALADGDSIEAIIRETGVNSDGRTRGITMPNWEAQSRLIQDTYTRSGLDPKDPEDRCHAGDPNEARAIENAFFGNDSSTSGPSSGPNRKLFVGSVKTVIGHTEGAAGLAGVLKVVQSMRHNSVPPNLHLDRLNPEVRKYYANLLVPTSLAVWPNVPAGQPKRGSVNSFGFGGTNAHAIIEETFSSLFRMPGVAVCLPLVLSAPSTKALATRSGLASEELAWHCFSRRTAFPFRVSVSSLSASGLAKDSSAPKILGVFTGQGAQWATMSRGLLLSSVVYANTIQHLDRILQACHDPPAWSLEQEILADEHTSRVRKAYISQPLCTAIQLGLVELLRHLGIRFSAVVGHSSGEIAAAYAAGKITIEDAMLIAHYRGLGEGGMLAAGLTEYSNGLWVAAINSSSSVTLSGDFNIQKFARMLFVDAAYHSPHMEGPSVEYLDSLTACGISSRQGNGTTWVSSVYGCREPSQAELTGRYWKDNMVKPVLFYEAVSTTLETVGPFDCAIEVGPHPSLMGPVTQTMREKNGTTVPYSGLLCRKMDDREAFASFLGWMWTQFGSSSEQIRQFVLGSVEPELVNTRLADAPTYPWDHSQTYWFESRISRQYHFKVEKPHELLGVRTRDDSKHQLRWRNILKLENLPWAKHHCFQGQALLPASAYLIMTLDAARVALAGRQASVVELRDLKFPSGIILEPHGPGVEILFNLTIDRDAQDTIDASFTLTSVIADGSTDMKMSFSGKLTISLGEPAARRLPQRAGHRAETLHANPEAFYDMMAGTGLVYTAPFKGLKTLQRRYNFASGTLKKYHDEDTTGLSISPATLDSCLQTAFVTISSPGDNAIWTSFLPLDMECVRFNLAICDIKDPENDSLAVDAYLTKEMPINGGSAASFTADIEIFDPQGQMEIQVQGLTVGSFSSTKPEEDYELYLTSKFDIDPDDEIVSAETSGISVSGPVLIESCKRVASFYTSPASIGRLHPAPRAMSPTSWPEETVESVDSFIRTSPYFLALDFIREVGRTLPQLLADVLPAVIEEARQLIHFQQHISRMVRQIAHKYPRMNVLGLTDPKLGLTEYILAGLQESFLLYRLGSEPEANLESRVLLTESLRKKVMVDKVNLKVPQREHGRLYDLVVLTSSLLESYKITKVLTAVKRMMRPGGFLVLVDAPRGTMKDRVWRIAGFAQGESDTISPPGWPDLLGHCGFVDCVKNSHQYYPPGFSLIVRQAESPEKAASHLADHLLVVGGKQQHTSLISSGLCTALTTRCGAVELAETLDSHDVRTLASFSAEHMDALRALFRPQMTILWVTYNARISNPDHAASFGFARTLAAETPGLPAPAVEAVTVAFARLTNHEREVHLENGHRLVPRVIPWKDGNDRVNAPRRVVSNIVNTLENVVRIVPAESEDGSCLCEVEIENVGDLDVATHQRGIQVNYSTARPMSIGGTGRIQVALTESNSSYAVNQPAFLAHLVRYSAAFIISRTVQGKSVLLIQPDKLFYDTVKDILAKCGIQLRVCSTDLAMCTAVPGAIKALYPREGAWLSEMFEQLVDELALSKAMMLDASPTTMTTGPFQIVDWRAERSVSQIVKPLAGTQLLHPAKTLCTLFVQQGARYITELDVTSLEQVVEFKSKLAETLPPVGGVVNGAMVLDDRVFSEMPLETLHRVMKPKAVGADMDFFIMTSSFAAIGGHAGQSNYAAANMYMNGLAASRRQRGLPGSVLNIGKGDLYEGLEREGYPPISERDVHHMFIYDIITGLRRFPAHAPTLNWHNLEADCMLDRQQQKTLKQLIEAADTKEAIVDLLVHGFVAHLQSQLQLAEGSVTGEHSIVELGVDSLVAVDVRSWIWKTLGQDVAVMKILGGSTILKLCQEIAAAIMESRVTDAKSDNTRHPQESRQSPLSTPSAERVVPGSANLPPAPWPASATTPTASIDAPGIAAHIIASLNDALAKRDFAAVAGLFLPDPNPAHQDNNAAATPYWRDHLVLSWRLRTLKGQEKIISFLEDAGFSGDGGLKFREVRGVGFFVTVENAVGKGRGVVRLVEYQPGEWKIWTVFTTLEEISGFEERTGQRREVGVQHGATQDRRNWAERRMEEREFVGREPEVLIIGAGQAGLTAAARLKMLGVPTLVIDKNKAVGDNWRNRYRQLVLHDPVWYDHMPYIPFPDSWPVFTPKNKLADWFESYVKALDLDVWTQSSMVSSSWDGKTMKWKAVIQRLSRHGSTDRREFHPSHIIVATGHSGKAYMPSIPGMDSFKGDLLCHSANFPGAGDNRKGKNAVVVGACNSSMDICQDYVEKGYDVTVVQRSSTYVISSDNVLKVSLGGLYEEGGPATEDSDITVWGWPSEVLKSIQVDLTNIAGEKDMEVLDGLERAGFKVDMGPSGGGIFCKYLQRGGGYYIDVGAAKLIIDGKVKVKHGQEIAQVLPNGLKFADGSELEADEIVFATGYENMKQSARGFLEDELFEKVGDVWGWDGEGEMRTIWTGSGHPGLWFHGGNLSFCRYYSRLVALQILASLRGLNGQV